MSTTIRGIPRTIAVTAIPGGLAGTHVLDGHLFASGSLLISVRQVGATMATAGTDLTSEFSISGHNTITNSGGTVTTGDFLIVTYANPASA